MQDPIADTYTGPIPVFMDEAAKGLGAKVEWVAVNWDTMMAGLQAKQYDVLGTAVYATETRKKVADFVNFSRSGICYVSLKSAAKVSSRDSMRSDKHSIVIPSGASFTQDLPKAYPKIEVATKPFPPGANDFFDDIRAGRYDLTIIEGVLAPQIAAQNSDLQVVPAVDECLASPDFPIEIGIAVNKGDAAFENYLAHVVKDAAPEIEAAVKNNSK
jgi:ABC-type amino acid transport substrate-binding protein